MCSYRSAQVGSSLDSMYKLGVQLSKLSQHQLKTTMDSLTSKLPHLLLQQGIVYVSRLVIPTTVHVCRCDRVLSELIYTEHTSRISGTLCLSTSCGTG